MKYIHVQGFVCRCIQETEGGKERHLQGHDDSNTTT